MPSSVSVTAWLTDPRPDAGLQLLGDDWAWRDIPYRDLAGKVGSMAEVLRRRGLGGQRLAMVAETTEDFLVRFFAVMATGGTAVPLPILLPGQEPGAYRAYLDRLVAAARADLELTPTALPSVAELSPAPSVDVVSDAGAPAMIQFTSGTSGVQKAVRVGRRALERAVGASRDWMDVRPSDRSASWLPLYHDMGLGTALTPIVCQWDLMLMSSFQFLERPELWLRCYGEMGCTMGATPAFALNHLVRSVNPATLPDCDLSGWRMAVLGSEPVRAEDLDAFVTTFGPLGFRRRTFCVAYGMSEATLGVTGTALEQDLVALGDSWSPPEPVGAELRVGPAHGEMSRIVSSGRPLGGMKVSVRGADGEPVPAGVLGEIWVGGETLADGYETATGDDGFVGDWFRTGDVGLLRDDELFVFGRLRDAFQIAGELVLAEQAEMAIKRRLPELKRLVVLPSRSAGAGLTTLVESRDPWDEREAEAARREISALFQHVEVDLVVVGPGGIPRTTSGKAKRSECWRRYVAGDLA